MKNRIKELRQAHDWSQTQLADAINSFTARHAKLRKVTKKNPDGLIDQQTVARLESGDIDLTDRYLQILSDIFSVTPNDILAITSDDEFQILQWYRGTPENKRKALLAWLSTH